ncbi:hypothetical protein SLEP1_g28082 [Rubroshorea leprosula]|uniref:Pectinesterase n=1 Tax=Rubroshorea leprosula TaxID=152421 RepID=A0AAV5K1V9_9ROSI|nr:hypothetical protein SLEP1_g28082 [Rubroshorea leprosula]
MAMEIKVLLLLIISFTSIVSTSLARSSIAWWCHKTPYPELCEYYMRHHHPHHHRFAPKHLPEFRNIMIQIAINRALVVRKQVADFGVNCQTWNQKAAWSDCLKLYDNTILQLNQTLEELVEGKKCTEFDAQTWLSTALTNLQTCQRGSMDMNVSNFLAPITSDNLTDLIRNSLAINGAFLHHKNYTPEASPSWLTEQDKRFLLSTSVKGSANLVVAKDGSGHYGTVQAALDAAARRSSTGRFIIYVKRGVYRENIEVANNNNDIMLVGDGMRHTIITGSRSIKTGYTTYSSATAGIDGLGFMARDITFSNVAGPANGQAVALRSASDLSVFYRCAIQGYQDTLFVLSQRQFYRECYIYGTVDFIFGNAAVVFQKCMIFARRPITGQANMITAQGRDDPYQNTGITFHNCQILPDHSLTPVVSSVNTYLGRPWQQYARTVILKTNISNMVNPAGWSQWGNSNFALDTLYYGEYGNYGPGASTKRRVRWEGFHVITNPSEASAFTVTNLIAGQSWLPATGVPFTAGL